MPQNINPSSTPPLLTLFTTFLAATLHTLLHHRGLYPPATFLSARVFNLSVYQSRHPAVCAWVRSATDAIAAQLTSRNDDEHSHSHPADGGPGQGAGAGARAGAGAGAGAGSGSGSGSEVPLTPVARIALLVVHHPRTRAVLERWILDVCTLPLFWHADNDDHSGNDDAAAAAAIDDDRLNIVNMADTTEVLRGALRRIAFAAEGLPALPPGCTFTVAVELRDDAPAPIGHPQAWIPSEASLQPQKAQQFGSRSSSARGPGADLGGARTTPIRSVQAGPLFFECWVEEGEAKLALENAEVLE